MADYTIIGCGALGTRVAKRLLADNQRVVAVAHDEKKVSGFKRAGLDVVVADYDYQEDIPDYSIHGHKVFHFMPPQGGGTIDNRTLNICRRLSPQNCPQSMVYISTSGVYGDSGTELVTEEWPLKPLTSRAKRRVSAETLLSEKAHELGFDLTILRATNIYGPMRLPKKQIHQGHHIVRLDQALPTSRIHSRDLIEICLTAIEHTTGVEIYNVCDNDHRSMSEYFVAVANLLEMPVPEQLDADQRSNALSPLTFDFMKESRLLCNHKILNRLGFKLQYPTLAEGLQACGDDQ